MAAAIHRPIERFSTREQIRALEQMEARMEMPRKRLLRAAENAGVITSARDFSELTYIEADNLTHWLIGLMEMALELAKAKEASHAR